VKVNSSNAGLTVFEMGADIVILTNTWHSLGGDQFHLKAEPSLNILRPGSDTVLHIHEVLRG